MNENTTGRISTSEQKTDWERVARMSNEEVRSAIDSDLDIHATNEDFWKGAKVVMPRHKEVITMRLDADLLEWFRQEKGYQTKINAILRSYMTSHISV